jgi:hypothetical protein
MTRAPPVILSAAKDLIARTIEVHLRRMAIGSFAELRACDFFDSRFLAIDEVATANFSVVLSKGACEASAVSEGPHRRLVRVYFGTSGDEIAG